MQFARRLAACLAVLCGPGAGAAVAQFGLYFDLADLDGTNAKRFVGELRASCTGAPSTIGDVNDDGFDDLIIAAPCWGLSGFPGGDDFPGTVYVVFGGPSFDQIVSMGMEELDGTNGFAIEGPQPSAFFGQSLVSGFDWNGDGVDDLAAGAPSVWAGPNNDAGKVFVIFGQAGIGAGGSFDLSTLDGSNGFVIDGVGFLDELGRLGFGVGDFNDDDWPDLAIGARAYTEGDAGRVYVVFGGPTVGASGSFDLASLDGSNGFVINGIMPGDRAGTRVTSAGDLNDDGFEDLAMGSYAADPNGLTDAGQSYVLFCGPGVGASGVIELADLDGTNGFIVNGPAPNAHAYRVSAGGDVNGDGVADLVVGQDAVGGHEARSAVIFGGPAVGVSGVINIAGLAWPVGVQVIGTGHHGAGVGDINHDGLAEVAVVHEQGSPLGRYSAGTVSVVFGDPDLGIDGPVDVDALDGSDGFYVYGERSGVRLRVAYPLGDLNRDGIGDFGVHGPYTRPGAPPEDIEHGAVYVIFGRPRFAPGDFDQDGDVDLDDFAQFAACYNGTARPPAPVCPAGVDADLDGDGDVDLDDFAIFAANYTGSL